VEAAGIRDILSKNYGSNNPVNVVKAAIKGLQELRSPEEMAQARGKTLEDFLGHRGAVIPAGGAESDTDVQAEGTDDGSNA
jgi:hypothetical protein